MNTTSKTKPEKKVNHSFAAGALIMTIGMFIVKLAGAAFKIPLSYILGGVGFGYFTTAYNMYSPIHALATAGLPIAISRMVSGYMTQGRYKDVKLMHKISIPLFMATGLFGSLLMIFGSFYYVQLVNAPGSLYSLLALAPTIFFSCLISIYKGYYEGLRNMIPTAVSEIIEAFGKVIFGISLSWLTVSYGMSEFQKFGTVFGTAYETKEAAKLAILPWVSAAAVVGITLGSVAGYLYMLIKFKISGDGITPEELKEAPKPYPVRKIMKMLLSISIPVALGAIIMNVASAIDSTLIQTRLNDIMTSTPEALLKVYGSLIPEQTVKAGKVHIFLLGCFGYMNTVAMVLPTITQGFAISALPNVTSAWVSGVKEKIKSSIETVLKVTSIVSLPIGIGMSVLSLPIMDLIYNTFGKNKSAEEVIISSHIMSIYALGIIFVAIGTPICSTLQAVGRADIPLKALAAGVVMKIALNYILVGIPEINIQGAGIGTLICYLFVCAVTLFSLKRQTKVSLDFTGVFLKPLLCALVCGATAWASQGLMALVIPYKLATVIAIALAAVAYVFALFLTKTVTSKDLATIPKCKKIIKVLEKFGMMS